MRRPSQSRRSAVIILAAGKATRMESDVNKVLHPVAGKTMLAYVLETVRKLQPAKTVVVIGHQGEQVQRAFRTWPRIEWAWQKEMRGTGDAVAAAAPAFKNFSGPVLVLYGDIPGVRVETLRRLAMVHNASTNAVTLLTAELDDPTGYGRILLDADGSVARIVEEKDATDDEKEIQEVNTGIGLYDGKFLFEAVRGLKPTNRQKELYLTDVVAMAKKDRKGVGRFRMRDSYEIWGINDRESLASVSRLFFEEKAVKLLQSGVYLEDPPTASIEADVEVGKDAVIGSQVSVRGKSRIGAKVVLGSCCDMEFTDIGSGVRIGSGCVVSHAKIGAMTTIGANSVIGR